MATNSVGRANLFDTPPIRYEIRRSYTALGQPESVHLVSAEGEALSLDHKVNYAWNNHGQFSGVISLVGEFAYKYDSVNPSLLAKMIGPVHEVETTYEPHRNLITGVTNRGKREGTPISSYTYGNDVLGRRETISQGGEAFAMLKLGDTKVEVAYNDRSEVVGATYKTGNETRQQFSYDYDDIGNRKEAQSTVNGQRSRELYKVNALNQYEAISEEQRQSEARPVHDLDGNLIEDDKNRYSWDCENRLVQVESKDGKTRVEYVHDYQSRRTLRIETRNPGEENESRKATYYLYDDWNVLVELEFSLSPSPSVSPSREKSQVRFFTWGRDLSGTLQGAGGVGGLLATTKVGQDEGNSNSLIPNSRFYLYDANGNVSQLIDETGVITAAYVYDPFGNVAEMAGPDAESNPWRFSTKPVDEVTGFLYYGFRYYNSQTGRWINRDPIEEGGGANLHMFLSNSAINKLDFLGLYDHEICIPIIPETVVDEVDLGYTEPSAWRRLMGDSIGPTVGEKGYGIEITVYHRTRAKRKLVTKYEVKKELCCGCDLELYGALGCEIREVSREKIFGPDLIIDFGTTEVQTKVTSNGYDVYISPWEHAGF